MSTSFEWSPWLPDFYYALLGVSAVAVLLLAFLRQLPDFAWRAAALGLIAIVLFNPIVRNEVRDGLRDKLVIVVDESPSQHIGGRDKAAEQALQNLTEKLSHFKNIDPVVIRSGSTDVADKGESTNLFAALRNSLMGIPLSQVAGTVFITDGQVHDVPAEPGPLERLGPFHVLLTGKKDEFDRKITIVSAPKYGLLDDGIDITVKVEQTGGDAAAPMPLEVFQDGQKVDEVTVTPGELRDFSFKVEHPGQNVYEFAVPAEPGELTEANNRAPVIVNGIRDRLRVLLVSGSPHMGERAWRNLLKSDPSIDLIHFTILRSMLSVDPTPQSQLSLIAFPVEQLFETNINDFDLIIFDRYQNYDMLMQPYYFANIAGFVRRGGAFLMALGTGDAAQTMTGTALSQILPVNLGGSGGVLREPFRPALTDLGRTHPVTADLLKQFGGGKWGQWFTQVDVPVTHGDTLMSGAEGKPLLVLDKAGEGRVAVLASDNIWLWSKGMGQAGPYTELLRNVAHWLMKEPELENDYIKAEAKGATITVSERDLSDQPQTVVMTAPSGETKTIPLDTRVPGWITADVPVDTAGIYSFDNGRRKAFAVVGAATNQEFSDVRTTEDRMRPAVDATKGGIIWFPENQDFSLKEMKPSASVMAGRNWLGIRRNSAYVVDNVEAVPLLPNWLCLITILSISICAWWRESGPR